MTQIAERVRTRIQDPNLTTSMGRFLPRRGELFPPASQIILEASEAKLGFALPPLLRELYTQVANGGFGPGYGILGLEGGFVDTMITLGEGGGHLLDWYYSFRGTDERMPDLRSLAASQDLSSIYINPDPEAGTCTWFDKLLPIAHHGDWQLSCIDCSKLIYPVLRYDGQQSMLTPERPTFEAWMDGWLAGPRGAQQHEHTKAG